MGYSNSFSSTLLSEDLINTSFPHLIITHISPLFEPMKTFSPLSVMGKAEGEGESWHGHVTAVTVGPEYRRLGLARKLMLFLEDVSERV
jgi:ribosomal protein S18 acetylase RimI-like enzyme